MKLLGALVAVPIMLVSQAGYADTGQKTPAEVANLYIAFVVHNDVDAARVLNDYTRPALGGKDLFDLDAVGKIRGAILDVMAKEISGPFGEARSRELAEVLVSDTERSACQAADSNIAPVAKVPSSLPTAATSETLHFHCQIVNTAKTAAGIMTASARNPSVPKNREVMVGQLIVALREASIDQPFDGEILMTRHPDPQTGQDIWTASPGDLYKSVATAISFRASEDIAPEPVEK